MNNMFRKIKWAYQRVVRGYDERIEWGFDGYFEKFIEPLYVFCSNYLKTEESKLNPERSKIFKKTIKLIKEFNKIKKEEVFFQESSSDLWKYFGENIGWYWN